MKQDNIRFILSMFLCLLMTAKTQAQCHLFKVISRFKNVSKDHHFMLHLFSIWSETAPRRLFVLEQPEFQQNNQCISF